MPLLEAQGLGVPVVTTAFGAMADYTRYGYAVPPAQQHFMVRGLCAYPDLAGVVAALRSVAEGEAPNENRTAAMDWVSTEFSPSAVSTAMASFLNEAVLRAATRIEENRRQRFTLTQSAVKAAATSAEPATARVPSSALRPASTERTGAGTAASKMWSELTYEGSHTPAVGSTSFYDSHWVLVRSEQYELIATAALERMLTNELNNDPATMVILRALNADGSYVPRGDDLTSGRVDGRLTFLVRRDLVWPAAKTNKLTDLVLKILPGAQVKLWHTIAAQHVSIGGRHEGQLHAEIHADGAQRLAHGTGITENNRHQ